MLTQSLAALRERVLKMFPERQFFHRTGGEIDFFVLGTKTQLAVVGLGTVVLLWCLLALFNLIRGQDLLRSAFKEFEIREAQYERYLVNARAQEQDARNLLSQQQKHFELAARNFQDKHNTIVTMITQGGIARTEEHPEPATFAASDIVMSPTTLDPVERTARREFAAATPMQTGTILDASLFHLDANQSKILAVGEDHIQRRIEENRAILRTTGLAVLDVLGNGGHGVGGPLVSLSGDAANLKPGDFIPRLDAVKARSAEAEALDKAIASVPFGYPIDAESYVTSRYGTRKDPFTKRPTMHTGMDIASYRMAPIVAAAGGKVTYSGRKAGGYGQVVEIDHGHGFKTRYGHLGKTFVRRGQTVETGEKIAGMGSTGRSTSTHLHYEILFENRALNPEKFLKAGRYVQ